MSRGRCACNVVFFSSFAPSFFSFFTGFAVFVILSLLKESCETERPECNQEPRHPRRGRDRRSGLGGLPKAHAIYRRTNRGRWASKVVFFSSFFTPGFFSFFTGFAVFVIVFSLEENPASSSDPMSPKGPLGLQGSLLFELLSTELLLFLHRLRCVCHSFLPQGIGLALSLFCWCNPHAKAEFGDQKT